MQAAHEIAEAVRNGTLLPSTAIEASLARIEALENQIEAWV